MTGQDEERVALVDDDGRETGAAPRSRVRAENLLHGATAILVRDPAGRVYVHRRTTTKDVYPGLHDCCAGGVLQPAEDPADGAARELAEELGVTGVPLRPVATGRYEDEDTRYVAHLFEAVWDGPVTWQASEVAWGEWMEVPRLLALLDDPSWPFVPDSRALAVPYLRREADPA